MARIEIIASRDGFRRAGIVHPARAVIHRAENFTPAQLALLETDPGLTVRWLDPRPLPASADPAPAEPAVAEPAAADPAPVDPATAAPTAVDPVPAEPAPEPAPAPADPVPAPADPAQPDLDARIGAAILAMGPADFTTAGQPRLSTLNAALDAEGLGPIDAAARDAATDRLVATGWTPPANA